MVLPHHIAISLAGTWKLLNHSSTDLNGNPTNLTDLGKHPAGQLIYDANGYMSASMTSTDPDQIPPNRSPAPMTQEDYILIGQHTLVYAGELHVAWENSSATVGRLTHGPLIMSNKPSWLGTNQTRNYIVTKKEKEGDILHLWLKDEKKNMISNIFWVRGGPT
ncbi:Lipocalin-like domain-containing protein [Phaeosphaeriaceae sp. PMI808]|nr:Lipocalin-like domain-containing protein [Phaeosphaeriaceae sp. PMI808]